MTRYNTWMIDDRNDVAVNNILNHIKIPRYEPNENNLNLTDDSLLKLIQFFQQD